MSWSRTGLLPNGRTCPPWLLFGWNARDLTMQDRVTGAAITVARASAGTAYDSNGLLYSVAENAPRYRYSPDSLLALLIEGARTNVALRCRNLGHGSWTKSNITATQDQIGIDGIANAASKILATGANGTCLQAVTLASSDRYQTAYVKRLTGAGALSMTTDGGATWTVLSVTGAWQRLGFQQTLANPSFGFKIVTNGDAFAIDFVQNEDGLFATTPIPTVAAAATRAADVITTSFLAPTQALTVFASFTETLPSALTGSILQLGTLGAYCVLYRRASNNISLLVSGNTGPSLASYLAVLETAVRARGVLRLNGDVFTGVSVGGAVETVSAVSATSTGLLAAFAPQTLRFGGDGTVIYTGSLALQSLAVALGEPSLDALTQAVA